MTSKLIYGITAIALAIVLTVFLLQRDPLPADGPVEPRAAEQPASASPRAGSPETQPTPTTSASGNSLADDGARLAELREEHGYYASGSSDIDSMHPYELYDLATLEELAAQDDGLAQLVLADKLVVTDPERADHLYWQAAVNGKTAALTNLAASHLVLVPGGSGFGFDLTSSDGEVSAEYARVLANYAAAEDLGDPIATEMLKTHVDEAAFRNSAESLIRICEAGLALADEIRAERLRKWGSESPPSGPMNTVEDAICTN